MHDDKFYPSLLEKFVPMMDNYPNVSLVTSFREEFGQANSKNSPIFLYLQPGKKIIEETLKDRNWIGEPTCVMFRKSNLWLGDFNSKFIYFIDWEMWLRQLSIGDCYIIPETLSYFRVHNKQVSSVVMKNMLHYCERYYFYKEVREVNKGRVDFSSMNIDNTLKEKAADCIKCVLKLIPRLMNKKDRLIFSTALKIIFNEKIPFHIYLRSINNSAVFKKFSSRQLAFLS